jgi:serine/threonine protein kinase
MKQDEKKPAELANVFAERERADAMHTLDGGSQSAPNADATCLFSGDDANKKERDVAFAVAALDAGLLSSRQLAAAVIEWTFHGDKPLGEHLVDKDLLTTEHRNQIEVQADQQLSRAVARLSATGRDGRQSASASTFGQLDTNGQVVKLLGLDLAPDWDTSDQHRKISARYKLLRQLGQGGMGTVWLALDEQLGRLVAIKEMRHGGDSSAAMLRFRREAQVTGRLEHPSIVPVHQLGENTESGKVFYVMRFLGKRTLEDAIAEYHERREAGDKNPLHLHRLLTSFVTICQAIAFANSRNVVHRDLKPENVALDDYGQVIVLDWGLAKLNGRGDLQEIFGDLELGDAATTEHTSAGQVLGTPMYMAPEQAAGRIDEIEQTTDVYGLGAILFAIMTGCAPHEKSHDSLTSTSRVTELFQQIVSKPAPHAVELNPDAPAELDAVCAKAMANRRYARYATALELADDVQRWMAGEPVSTYTEPWRTRARRWMSKHRRTSLLTGALLTIFVVSTITWALSSHQNRVTQRHARFESMKADAREFEVSLRSAADDLAKNARFMSTLPPIQGVINARAGIEGDDEKVWHDRLQTIYCGLLEANPNYLSATYMAADDDLNNPAVTEIVRVERQVAGGSALVLPASRLATLEQTGMLHRVLQLKPGDVTVDDKRIIDQGELVDSQSELVLTSATAIYSDHDGQVFGVVAIETDLEHKLRELLVALIAADQDAYIVDGEGNVILHYSREHEFHDASVGKKIGTLVGGCEQLFTENCQIDKYTLDQEIYATKIELDPRHHTAPITIVLTVEH